MPQPEEYTVAWICALHIEMAAARAMLDEIHESPPRDSDDTNAYVQGSIKGHNIVIACLPVSQYGTNNAATVATNLKRTYPAVHMGLMVGIGGGVPSKGDIRLGDIVVGTKVMHYDLGKIRSDGKFERTATPRTLELSLATAVTSLRSKHELISSRVPSILQQKLQKHPEYGPPSAPDRLFQTAYEHKSHALNCDECDQSKLIPRGSRKPDTLKIHYGAIASGNQVMKHGTTRDNIARELDVICFEMEAAGLMDILPFISIRGICDYSDSHKSKEWQKYAAATAAAYARELIEELPVRKEQTRSSNPASHQPLTDQGIRKSLAFAEMMARRDNIEACHENTCQWILVLKDYISWKSHPRGLLWIKGKPGAGKSTLMAFLYEDLKKTPGEGRKIQLEFFFTARGTELQRTPIGMLRSLLNQIFACDAAVRPQIREAYTRRCSLLGSDEQQWEWPRGLLEDLLADAIITSASRQPLTLFVDALDEAGSESAQQLADYFHRLNHRAEKNMAAIKIYISCRHYPNIRHRATEITVENHNQQDITSYIKDHILTDPTMGNDSDPEMWQGLIDDLAQQANGVFQWAHIIMPIIQRKVEDGDSPSDIRDWLPKVPAGLEDIYRYILSHVIEDANREQSFFMFQWLCLSERPLTVTEMRYAMAAKDADIGLGKKQWSKIKSFVDTDNRMKLRIKAFSGGLAEIVSNETRGETVQLVHQSVNDFLRDGGLVFLSELIGGSSPCINDKDIGIISQCHAAMYKACLIYFVTTQLSHDSLDHKSWTRDSEELVKNNPLLNYATINLFVHAEKASRSRVFPNEVLILQEWISCWVKVYQLLDRGAKTCPATGTTLLHMAAATNMVDMIDVMGYNSVAINQRNEEGQTALHFAATRGHKTAAEILQAKGADCEAKCKDQRTPLVEAASHGHVKFVEWLLSLGANVNISTGLHGTALQTAASNGQEGIVRILLGAGANITTQGGYYGNALQAAAYSGSVEVVRILLGVGAKVNA